jgi:hypothetical protein
MAKKLTLEMKKQISREVVAETKRCLSIINKIYYYLEKNSEPDINKALDSAIKEIIKECPYINVHPELKKLIPKS